MLAIDLLTKKLETFSMNNAHLEQLMEYKNKDDITEVTLTSWNPSLVYILESLPNLTMSTINFRRYTVLILPLDHYLPTTPYGK